ncbi:hypothetical protein IV203_001220 [Nitzschia inconspicua]|uniref:Uncharacterized protein n=1 Tax=Nitzschia inconspicua TaxID=303405 RepID=A0A9K3P9P2_9STRA|nr:hypothetical protein IV203_002495 [Nitzschia inconspicua]KAG7356534.1 hypothetical protein IV203_001220 [Nitzschia inconspicua]
MNSSQPPHQHIKDGQMPVPPGGQEEFGSGQHNPSSQLSGPLNGHPTSSKPYNSHTSPLTLELFTILAHHLVLEAAVPTATLHHASVAIWCDNTTAVAWANKLRSSSSHFAHRILRLLTVRLLHNQECPFTTTHITGKYNTLADFASRKHPTEPHAFLTAFTSSFPPPQNSFWTLCQLPNATQQKLFLLLRPQPLAMESLLQLNLNDSAFGRIGKTSSETLFQCTSPSFQTTHCQPDLPCWEPSLHLFGLANTNQQINKSPPKQSYSPRPTDWMDN